MQEYQTETEGSSAESSLLRFLLPDDQKLRDANYVAETTKYLSDLSQFSLDKVAEEPTRLAIEREHIQREMHDLAFKNYKTFIQTSECTREIRNQLSGVSGGIDKTTHHLTDLNVSCQDFISQANKISTKRKAANTTLKQHSTLLELLELPQMIDTCIKSQYYEEALELKQFTARMFRSHPEVKVLKLIYDDVEKATEMMIAQLHQQLSTTTQLAQCSRAIGYLSRLQVYDNREIRVCFLQCRDISMQNVLSLIPTNNAYNYLSKLIDACRAQYFDIITQYKTIFDTSTDEDSSSTTEEDEGILYSWLVHKISDFIQLLKKYLPQISDGSSILNIMNQCMYLGSSLSKAGADFRALLVPIFEKCILDMFLNTLHTGVDQFTMTIKKFTPPQNTPSSGPVSLNSSFSAPSPTVTPTKEDPSKLQPPRVLIDYVPLALLLNSILQGFNELRKCCPQSLQTPISTALFNALNHVVDLTVNVINAAKPEDKKGYAELCRVTCEEFIPFVARAVVSLFDSPRRLIATEELTNKLIDFYGPTPQNLTKLLLEEKKLQENNSYGSSDTSGSEQTKNEENNTNTTEGTNNTEPVPSANNEKAIQDESSSTQATPANADQGQDQAPKDDSTAAVKTTNDVQQQEDATSTERLNEGQVEQAASSSTVEPTSSENLPNDKSE